MNLDSIFDDDRQPMGTLERTAITRPEQLPGEWRELYEERAAIREYDGGQCLEHAEAEAFREVLDRMRAAGDI